MNMQESIQSCFRQYSNIEGRASRSEYWWFVLFGELLVFGTLFFIGFVSGLLNIFTPDQLKNYVAPVIQVLIGLGLFLPNLAVGVRRLHDYDLSGWWLLLSLTIIGAIPLVIIFMLKGTVGPNRFGEDPLMNTKAGQLAAGYPRQTQT